MDQTNRVLFMLSLIHLTSSELYTNKFIYIKVPRYCLSVGKLSKSRKIAQSTLINLYFYKYGQFSLSDLDRRFRCPDFIYRHKT